MNLSTAVSLSIVFICLSSYPVLADSGNATSPLITAWKHSDKSAPALPPGTVSADQNICSGNTPSNITLTGSTGSIQWQVSSDNNSWSNISGATGATLTSVQIGALTETRYYRAEVVDGMNTDYSATVTVFVLQPSGTLPSGSGTVGSPYFISNLNELIWISNNSASWDKVFEQTASFSAAATSLACYNGGYGFLPIGNAATPFTGHYNGNTYAINNLYINRVTADSVGLFKYVFGGTLNHMTLSAATITGRDRVGGIVGMAAGDAGTRTNLIHLEVLNSTIVADPTNATASGAVGGVAGCTIYTDLNELVSSGTVRGRQRVGGLVGYLLTGSQIRNSYSSANVSSNVTADTRFIGGAFGVIESFAAPAAVAGSCYATGTVSLSTATSSNNGDIGGFAGLINGYYTVSNCYALGATTGPVATSNTARGTGGFAGRITANTGSVSNCYSTGSVNGSVGQFGGFTAVSSGVVSNCFWNTTTSTRATSAAGTGATTAQLQLMNTFFLASWDMACERLNGNNDYWGMNPSANGGYPFLSWQPLTAQCPEWTGNSSSTFSTTTNWVNNFVPLEGMDVVMNAAASRNLTLGQNWTMGHILFNGAGRNIELGTFGLTCIGAISGVDASNYIQTNGSGKLGMNIANGASVNFPVGNSAYNPVQITNNSGATDLFSVAVSDAVLGEGNSGGTVLQPHVQRTWDITKLNANAGAGVNFVFNWNPGEVSRILGMPALYHYNGTLWEEQTGTTSAGSNSLIYTGYTGSFSPFTVATAGATLPVTGWKLSATPMDNFIKVLWETASEYNTKEYVVERSANGINWVSITTQIARGNSTSVSKYEFVDQRPNAGMNYYRIKQFDQDGSFAYSPVTTVNFKNDIHFKVFPNPAQHTVFIQGNQADGQTSVQIYNAQGMLVGTKQFSGNSGYVPVQHLAAGIYHFKVQQGRSEEHIAIVKQ